MKVEHYYKPDSKTLREEPQVFTRWIDPTIEQLQQENKQLKEDIKTFKFTIKTQQQMIDELIGKIDKAIEYIVKNCILSDEWTDLDFCNFIPTGKITYKHLTPKKVKELLEILGDKENE